MFSRTAPPAAADGFGLDVERRADWLLTDLRPISILVYYKMIST